MEKLDSKIVALNGQKYLVYLKRVNVKLSKAGKNKTAIKAFVRKLEENIDGADWDTYFTTPK